ncbi:MAG: toll/interleukin-1 receptor domain-containing protein, partial [Isosphaeraceae bacterium]
MLPWGPEQEQSYDVFVSCARAPEHGDERKKVSALVRAILVQYQSDIGAPLRVFHACEPTCSMGDWWATILPALRQSRLMLAILSPAYFASPFCRREWEVYVETELAKALPGEGIIPIYVARHPAFEADPIESQASALIKDLRRRWCIDWLSFWPQTAFHQQELRRRLAGLPRQIVERLRRPAARAASPNTVPPPGRHFVGRRDELHMLLSNLIECQKCVLTAEPGIPGLGASTLAFAYAWGHGSRYPGGRFLIRPANLGDLAACLIDLAGPKGVRLDEPERQNPHLALAKVKAAFEHGPPALLLID